MSEDASAGPTAEGVPEGVSPLPPGARLVRTSVAWALLFAAGPGFLTPTGSLALGVLGLSVWGATALRPYEGRRLWSLLAEALPNGIGGGLLMAWVWYVFPGAFAYVALGFGVYWTATAALVRRLARHTPAALAVGAGVLGMETLRAVLPPPFGLGWIQLGHLTHHHLWLSGSARVWGLEGLSLVVASLGGLGAALLSGADRLARGEPRLRLREALFGSVPAALGVLLALVTGPPAERDGPHLLLVQPGFTQERKQFNDPRENYAAQRDLTLAAANELAQAGSPPDLVVWAESMLAVPLFAPGVQEALASGVNTPFWSPNLTLADLEDWREWEDAWVDAGLFGVGARAGGSLPTGTAFLAGAELYDVVGEGDDAAVRRRVSAVLYPHPDVGAERQLVYKRNLVPGAESMLGLEQLAPVRDTIHAIAAYIPDFVAGREAGVMDLATRDGASWRFGASICFDNAFLGAFTDVFRVASPAPTPAAGDAQAEPAPRRPLDFHLVISNEAWYHSSFELDQMVAFSRLAALATARSVVRGTNSGVSLVMGADGVERARIRDAEGRDRETAGVLSTRVPVPVEEHRAARTTYVRTRPLWLTLALLSPLGALLLGRRRPR